VVDPLASDYQSFSPYNYVLNNPLSNTDPDGRSVNTRFVNSLGQTIINTDDGRNDVIEVADNRVEEFKKNIESFSHDPGKLNSLGWNNYWRGEVGFTQTISGATLDKAGFNSLSSENVKSAAIEYLYGNRSSQSVVWQEVKAQWSNPVNVAMGLTAFAHGLTGVLQPKPHFGYPEIGNNTNHAIRYLVEAGLNVDKVKSVISKDLGSISSYKVGARIQGVVTVDGVTIKYSGTKLPNGRINIGTIQPPRKQ